MLSNNIQFPSKNVSCFLQPIKRPCSKCKGTNSALYLNEILFYFIKAGEPRSSGYTKEKEVEKKGDETRDYKHNDDKRFKEQSGIRGEL